MNSYSATDVGRSRAINQDYIFSSDVMIGKLPNLYIVADGMGGHNAGDFASRYCVEQMVAHIKEQENKTPIGMMGSALTSANETLIKKASNQVELQGMGTTCVVATIEDNVVYIANVGDSRLYVINESMKQVTQDHSLVEEMIRTGEISRDEVKFHPNKNIITRAIGASISVNPDFFEVPVKSKDLILICTDGLTNMVEDKKIQEIIDENREDLTMAANKLIDYANAKGGKDNISLIIVEV